MEERKNFTAFMKMVNLISQQNPLQQKRIESFIAKQSSEYWEYAEWLVQSLGHSFLHNESEWDQAARSYNRMCTDFLREQIRFRKTGVYLLEDAHSANREVYSQPEVMRYYMVGLLLSYLFWPNHYAILRFLKEHLQNISVEHYLEIAPGHGLFTIEATRRRSGVDATLVDISETSIQVTQSLLETFEVEPHLIQFVHGDILTVPLDTGNFDFIVMGEVLEHVNDALGLMARAAQLLHPKGTIYMTTCANCPAIDHVYHFHNVDEIRSLVRAAGLSIVRDIVLPLDDIPESRWEEELNTINYAVVLEKQPNGRAY